MHNYYLIIFFLSSIGYFHVFFASQSQVLQGTWNLSGTPLSKQKGWFNPILSIEELKKLLATDRNVNAVSEDGTTGLMFMAGRANKEGVRLFLEAGADVDFQHPLNGNTALHIAIFNASMSNGGVGTPGRDLEIVKILLDAGASVDLPNKQGLMPLHMTANITDIIPFVEAVTLLLKYGADINVQSRRGQKIVNEKGGFTPFKQTFLNNTNFTLLHIIAGAWEYIKTRDGLLRYWGLILDYNRKASFEKLPPEGPAKLYTPLEYLLDIGFSDVARYVESAELIKFTVDLKGLNNYYLNGLTGVLYAIVGRRKDLVQKFIEKKANLLLTTKKPDFTINSQLVESAKQIDNNGQLQSDGYGFTALHLAILQGNQEIVEMVLEAEPALLNMLDERGNSCYHHIARISNVEIQKKIFELLASKNIKNNNFAEIINHQNNNGETLLHKIVYTKNSTFLHYLVEHYGKYFNAKLVNKAQKTPIDYMNMVIEVDNSIKKSVGTPRQNLINRDNNMMIDLKKLS